jgi:hypothetical protein
MSTAVASPTLYNYRANVISSDIEPSDLDAEITKQTSSAVSDKSFEQRDWTVSPVLHDSDSFLSFINEILTFNSEEDDEDQISDDALGAALFTTNGAYAQKPNRWRKPRIATDGGGGVRLTWRAEHRELRAVFPAEMRRPHYLYVEDGEKHSAINNFTSITLWNKLDWLASTAK